MGDLSKTTIVKSNGSSSPFTQEFAKIIRRYKKHCQYIKRLLEDTNKSYDEIYEKRVLTLGIFDCFSFTSIDFLFLRQNITDQIVQI